MAKSKKANASKKAVTKKKSAAPATAKKGATVRGKQVKKMTFPSILPADVATKLPESFFVALKEFETASKKLFKQTEKHVRLKRVQYMPFCEEHGNLASSCMPMEAAYSVALGHKNGCRYLSDIRPCG